MVVSNTARLGLTRWDADSDPFSRAQLDADHGRLEDLVAIYGDGTLNARPAAGVRGRFYYATDTALTYYDTGTAWVTAGVPLGTTAAAPLGAAAAAGTAGTAARSDHVHPYPTAAQVGAADAVHSHTADDIASGTLAIARLPVAASGQSSAVALVRADDARLSDPRTPVAHTHPVAAITGLYDTTVPAPLGTAAAGTATTAARRDHVHAMPRRDQLAAPTGAWGNNGQRITGLGAPTGLGDAARLDEVRSASYGSTGRTERPYAKVIRTTNLAIPVATTTALAWSSTEEESDTGMGGTGGITAPIAGLYLVTLHVIWQGNTTGTRQASLLVAGAEKARTRTQPADTTPAYNELTTIVRVAAGDQLAATVTTSGAALSVIGSASAFDQSSLSALWIGP